MLIDHMATGQSFTTFAAVLNVGKRTMYDWCDNFPEFKEAKEIGQAKAQQFMEKRLIAKISGQKIEGVDKKDIDNSCLIFALKTRFHKDYGDVSKHHIQQETVQINIDGDDSEL